ncbi:MAG: type I glyceraldehyde-3-phosphate dehydrogenase, partial [Actinobacteria bacterium]|nr:type I glyceraldehyde-3-phosphate dehydrogenase [Actinomycetota bacterium]
GINGYGRIGRLAHRIILEKYSKEIALVAINAGLSTDIKGWMYLLKYDTVYGRLKNHKFDTEEAKIEENNGKSFHFKDLLAIGNLIIDGEKIPVFSQKDPSLLPWADLNVDVVIESTGNFRSEDKLKSHLTAGAKSVVLSAPGKTSDSGAEVPTFVLSVNAQNYNGEKIISNASCTTNCIAPVAKVINDNFGIEKAMMTTIHGYTSDQRLQDGGHKDYRRARAASQNIIPTSTGATIAAAKVIPDLKSKFDGVAIRIPVITGSISDFTFLIKKQTTKEEVNDILKKEAENKNYKGILEVTDDPLVSSDIIGSTASSIVDLSLTQVVGGNMLKIIAWYDNEWGYANRLVEQVLMVGKHIYANAS